jgi:purine-binding chemotaxis protein CheW
MSRRYHVCTFRVGSHLVGIDADWLREIVPELSLTRVPMVPAEILGLANLRGDILTVIDLGLRLGVGRAGGDDGEAIDAVVQAANEAMALRVDSVEEVFEMSNDDLDSPPETLESLSREFIRGEYQLANELVLVLEPERVLEPGDRVATT